mmetsp:Transcript_22313/g.51586  ORF Transcript_22313/g.51586 Transcript_22313/m.51586 type:complete len:251 (-) Transcript_22313:737-1489(-)
MRSSCPFWNETWSAFSSRRSSMRLLPDSTRCSFLALSFATISLASSRRPCSLLSSLSSPLRRLLRSTSWLLALRSCESLTSKVPPWFLTNSNSFFSAASASSTWCALAVASPSAALTRRSSSLSARLRWWCCCASAAAMDLAASRSVWSWSSRDMASRRSCTRARNSSRMISCSISACRCCTLSSSRATSRCVSKRVRSSIAMSSCSVRLLARFSSCSRCERKLSRSSAEAWSCRFDMRSSWISRICSMD